MTCCLPSLSRSIRIPVRQQENSYDCGIYVLQFIEVRNLSMCLLCGSAPFVGSSPVVWVAPL